MPPPAYGGAERVVDLLCRGLSEQGHQVLLVAPAGSTTPCELVPYPEQPEGRYIGRARSLLNFWMTLKPLLNRVDLVHSHNSLTQWLPIPALVNKPLVITFHAPIENVQLARLKWLRRRDLTLCSISDAQRNGRSPDEPWTTVHNGVDVDFYQPSFDPGKYLLYLGRISPKKGTHIAIEIAQRCGVPLLIAGNVSNELGGLEYFESTIKPRFGADIKWIGEVGDLAKRQLYQGALALLFPIQWEEPFGLVMAESLACGTPVIALNRGSVKEIVEHGATGFIGTSVNDLVSSVKNVGTIQRMECRASAVARFSENAMVARYVDVYRGAVTAR